jgi:hypothetical protein
MVLQVRILLYVFVLCPFLSLYFGVSLACISYTVLYRTSVGNTHFWCKSRFVLARALLQPRSGTVPLRDFRFLWFVQPLPFASPCSTSHFDFSLPLVCGPAGDKDFPGSGKGPSLDPDTKWFFDSKPVRNNVHSMNTWHQLKNLGYNDFENHVCFSFSRVPQEFPLCEIVLFQEMRLERKILDTTILVWH